VLARLQGALRALDPDQRLAGLAALGLAATLFLPWYEKNVALRGALVSESLSAFGVFSFVEAAVLLVALAVLVLLFARGERRGFHLPGGDGTVILGAGLWAAVLLLWRVFDRPDVEGLGATVGITWGFFFAFLAASALAAAGWRIRVAGRPEPPNPTADAPVPEAMPEPPEPPPTAATAVVRRPADAPATAATRPADPPARSSRRSRAMPDPPAPLDPPEPPSLWTDPDPPAPGSR
jgi:hypothetical protein